MEILKTLKTASAFSEPPIPSSVNPETPRTKGSTWWDSLTLKSIEFKVALKKWEASKRATVKRLEVTWKPLIVMGDVLMTEKKFVEASKIYKAAIRSAERVGASPSDTALLRWSLSRAYWEGGKADKAIEELKAIRKEIPEADAVLDTLEGEKLKRINLAALDVWSLYNKEAEAFEKESMKGVLGHATAFVDSLARDDNETLHHDLDRKWELEGKLLREVKKKIASGEAKTIKEALYHLKAEGPADLRERAKALLDEKAEAIHKKAYPIFELIDYTSKPDSSVETADDLLQRALEFEADFGAVNAPYAVYSLLHGSSSDEKIKERSKEGMEALMGKAGFGRSAEKFLFSMSPESLALDVGLMYCSAGLGNLAKLKWAATFEKAGVLGSRAVAAAAGLGVESTALWAGGVAKESALHNLDKVLDPTHLAKGYASTLLMVGMTKYFGEGGKALGSRAAKALAGEAKSALSSKMVASGIEHGAGLAGMIGSRETAEMLDLHGPSAGGWKESITHDLLTYFEFVLAHRTVEGVKKSISPEVKPVASPTSIESVSPLPLAAHSEMKASVHPFKGRVSSGPTFHAARIRLETLGKKIESGKMDPSDPKVMAEVEKCKTILAKYETNPTKVKPIASPTPIESESPFSLAARSEMKASVHPFEATLPESPRAYGADVRKASFDKTAEINARILAGDLKAIEEGGAFYVRENESIGGNAGDNRFAINAYVDPKSGKITAVGNVQNVPAEISKGAVKVAFLVKLPSIKEIKERRGEAPCLIDRVILREGELPPEIFRSLKILEGKPYSPPSTVSRTIDGRKEAELS